ncbi:MAG: alpha-N-arabinofuranosidase [Lachnospiraceae bacterium]|nr:alpha-N-arabinofuranosidase [Lachnospiraceae bacterium]
MPINLCINPDREKSVINPMIYGHFIEHFHRQIYDGIYDPANPLSDEDGLRTDIIDAMKKIRVPILRWPGGCFVSAYHWKKAVGPNRTPVFDKAWRIEDPNTFGTDEYIKLCRKIGCEPYICTNAGTGSAEEMSDWVEYCNLTDEGEYAKKRISNGYTKPHNVKYWSIGNENYGHWEIGAKSSEEWGRLVLESAKMMKHVDPYVQLSAAAIADVDWTFNLLKTCGHFLDWISVHQYWDMVPEINELADYDACMAYTYEIDRTVSEVRGMLTALKLEKKIKIAFDEWNLRSWHHPNVHTITQGANKEDYLTPRDKNDDNSSYTMADAVFAACFLNAMIRNSDIVGMANFAPVLNTRGCIYSYDKGIVLRSTYHVFDLYVNHMGDTYIDVCTDKGELSAVLPVTEVKDKKGMTRSVTSLDICATGSSESGEISLSVVNKDADTSHDISVNTCGLKKAILYSINGKDKDSYNDINQNEIDISSEKLQISDDGKVYISVKPHSVNVIKLI